MQNVARGIEDPPGWDQKKLRVMEVLMRDKFRKHRDLRERLAAT
jgi:predicted NAD-dependent protein-ADP-ribosyltransferase YbiA (DUF1768 family)